MNVNHKIWIGFGSVLALVGIGSTLSYFTSRQAEERSTELVKVNFAEFATAKSADDAMSTARIYEQKFANTRTEDSVAQLKARIDEVKAEMKTLQSVATIPAHATAAAAVSEAADAYLKTFDHYHQLMVRRGLTPDVGLEGDLRTVVHDVEAKVKDQGLAELSVILLTVRRHEKDYLLRGDPKYLDDINGCIKDFADQMKMFSLPATLQKEINAKWVAYGTAMKALVETDQEARRMGEDLRKAGEAVEDDVGKLAESCSQTVEEHQASTLATLAQGRRTTLGIGLASGLIGGAMAVWIAFSLAALNRSVRGAGEQLAGGASEILAASVQLTTASQTLANGSSEQAASLEETSASLEEMASMTKRTAGSAAHAKELTAQARTAADAGASEMDAMKRAMADIKTSSDDISKIIKTIDEIAFQTNILALNAAVEAARAGEAGMGFAVVADEVRNLAQRAAQSARETSGKIEVSVANSQNGVAISAKVAASLGVIVAKVREVDTLIVEIAGASSDQSQGISQVNLAVAQMDKVTQANAATAEESSSAATELSAQAGVLESAVGDLLALVGGRKETQEEGKTSAAGRTAAPAAEIVRSRTAAPATTRKHPPAKRPAAVAGSAPTGVAEPAKAEEFFS